MGRAARQVKERLCAACQQPQHGIAADLMEHVSSCIIAQRSGLILPGQLERVYNELRAQDNRR